MKPSIVSNCQGFISKRTTMQWGVLPNVLYFSYSCINFMVSYSVHGYKLQSPSHIIMV